MTPQCHFTHRQWGRCHQARPADTRHCSFHEHWLVTAGEPDAFYHRKILAGLLQPATAYLSPDEIKATMGELRYHGDGRRLDQYLEEEGWGCS